MKTFIRLRGLGQWVVFIACKGLMGNLFLGGVVLINSPPGVSDNLGIVYEWFDLTFGDPNGHLKAIIACRGVPQCVSNGFMRE